MGLSQVDGGKVTGERSHAYGIVFVCYTLFLFFCFFFLFRFFL